MPDSYRSRERLALAPLLELARGKSARELQEWLAYLRVEGPTVAARLERLLAESGGEGAEESHEAGSSGRERDGKSESEKRLGEGVAPHESADGSTDVSLGRDDSPHPPQVPSFAAGVTVLPLPLPPSTGESKRGAAPRERPERKRYVAPTLSFGLLVR